MSYLEKLLDGVDVEWKSFGEIAKIQRGASPRPIAKFITDDEDGVPWIKIGDTESGSKYVEQTAQKITKEGATKSRVLKKGDFIISNSMSFGRPYILNITGAIHDGWASISEFGDKLNSDFLYHYLSSQSVQNYWISKINSGSVSNLNADIIKTLPVPIPCPNNPEKSLAIQDEIARILDAFTAMTAELTAELNMRKIQYNYYRDQLLSFEDDEVEWKTLEEVAHFANGKGHEKDISENGKFIVVNSKFISTDGLVAKYSDSQLCPLFKDDILLVMSDLPNGKALSKTFIVDEDERYTLNQRIGAITVKDKSEMWPKFLHYYLDRTPQLLKHDNGVDQTNLRKGQILEVKVPILPLQKQEHIVSILDKFDKLTKSLSEGLPHEIELRQKQYEYYRDLLLSFPKSEEVTA
ncbi:restriction endonuclease subunit S [Acinetobacter sp. YH12255]|uniref:restriction endonuclease subunit S n=1 Tax=Acinetobacter sp. YH12255 TaxID=2601179 RepID=UPI001C551B68